MPVDVNALQEMRERIPRRRSVAQGGEQEVALAPLRNDVWEVALLAVIGSQLPAEAATAECAAGPAVPAQVTELFGRAHTVGWLVPMAER